MKNFLKENLNKSDYEKLLEEYRDFRKEAYKKQWTISDEALENSNLVDDLLVKLCEPRFKTSKGEEFEKSNYFKNTIAMETMYERFKRLYSEGRITKKGLENAVSEHLITWEEYQRIVQEVEPDVIN